MLEAYYHGTAEAPVTLLDGLANAYPTATYAQGSLLAEGLSLPIPRTALRTGAEPNAKPGLRAEYLREASVDGDPVLRTVVPGVDFDLDRAGPAPAITSKRYAARWSGAIVPPSPGDYTLHVKVERCWDCAAHDAFRLYLDGRLVLGK